MLSPSKSTDVVKDKSTPEPSVSCQVPPEPLMIRSSKFNKEPETEALELQTVVLAWTLPVGAVSKLMVTFAVLFAQLEDAGLAITWYSKE